MRLEVGGERGRVERGVARVHVEAGAGQERPVHRHLAEVGGERRGEAEAVEGVGGDPLPERVAVVQEGAVLDDDRLRRAGRARGAHQVGDVGGVQVRADLVRGALLRVGDGAGGTPVRVPGTWRVAFVGDDGGGPGRREERGDAWVRVGGLQVDVGGADGPGAEDGGHTAGRAVHERGHDVAPPDALFPQPAGHAARRPGQLLVGVRHLTLAERGARAAAGGDVEEPVCGRAGRCPRCGLGRHGAFLPEHVCGHDRPPVGPVAIIRARPSTVSVAR